MTKTALVVSGGGSKGAFAVGALRYIHDHVRAVDTFDVYCGTSTGSLIVPLAAIGELALLETQYTTLRQDDILKLGVVGNLLSGISLHDARPLQNTINNTLTPARYDRLRAGAKPLFLASVCLQTEQLVYWATQPGLVPATDNYEVRPIASLPDLRAAMLASACQPVLMQPVEVQPATRPVRQYVDGGVREATPLQAAVDAGATTIIALTLAPRTSPADPVELTKATDILVRTLDTLTQDVGSNDYRLTRLYAQGNRYLQAVRSRLLAQGVAASTVQAAFGLPNNPFGATAISQLHEIRPATALVEGGPGGLTFDPAAMKGMMAKGFAQAKAYFEALPPGTVA